jgi:DNA polymerase type B, organellar and viral.
LIDECTFLDATEIASLLQLPSVSEFVIATPEEMESAFSFRAIAEVKAQMRRHSKAAPIPVRPVCFIDGEGSNVGEPITGVKKGLSYSIQKQNYSLLGVEYDTGAYQCIVGENNEGQLSTEECLEFIFSIPDDYLITSFAFDYDVEQMLSDVPQRLMEILHRTKWVRWKRYKINYIKGKYFFIRKRVRKKNSGAPEPRRRIFDISGFFGKKAFKSVTHDWKVSTPEEQAFLERMKKDRPDFGPVTQETKDYNALEGVLGIRVFEKLRTEWTQLGLVVRSPHGAGSLAKAMYKLHDIDMYMNPQVPIPPSPILRAYIGGRFDFTRQGQFPIAYESDINSAYPHIMRSLPCLTHIRLEEVANYIPSPDSLWFVRWRDNGERWAPFPYRANDHIRYYSSGMGWYYGNEVASAIRYVPDLEILGGYIFHRECEDTPFAWMEEYYNRRQELKKTSPDTAEFLKIGMNAGYGCLAQTKGFVPPYQTLLWAGMITSGTRAMLLDIIQKDPESVIAVSTDSVTSLTPIPLDADEVRLGAWKQKELPNFTLLGNGFAYSENEKLKSTHRGFPEWNWNDIYSTWKDEGSVVVNRKDYNTSTDAREQKKEWLRRTWTTGQSRLEFKPPEGREVDSGGWIWPGQNPTPWVISEELEVSPDHIRVSQFGPPVLVSEW